MVNIIFFQFYSIRFQTNYVCRFSANRNAERCHAYLQTQIQAVPVLSSLYPSLISVSSLAFLPCYLVVIEQHQQQHTCAGSPQIEAPSVVHGMAGRPVTLQCRVDAWPKASVVWWRDPAGRLAVVHGGNTALDVVEGEEVGNLDFNDCYRGYSCTLLTRAYLQLFIS